MHTSGHLICSVLQTYSIPILSCLDYRFLVKGQSRFTCDKHKTNKPIHTIQVSYFLWSQDEKNGEQIFLILEQDTLSSKVTRKEIL